MKHDAEKFTPVIIHPGSIGLKSIFYLLIVGISFTDNRMMQNVEESLEVAGLIVFIRALMRYLSFRDGVVGLYFH